MADDTNDAGDASEGTDSRVTEWFGQSVASDTELAEQLSRDHDPETAEKLFENNRGAPTSRNVGGETASILSSANAPIVRTIRATPPTPTETNDIAASGAGRSRPLGHQAQHHLFSRDRWDPISPQR
ncbi:hypothetical protein BH24ACT5_BH24ACT5_28240 [soil metagenome]